MNIIKSKYTAEEIKGFYDKEVGPDGEKDIKKVETIQNLVVLMCSLLSALVGIVMYVLCHYYRVYGAIACISLIAPAWLALLVKVMDETSNGLFRITEKVMKRKGIRISPMMSGRFLNTCKEHERISKLVEFIDSHESARLEPYDGFGIIKVAYEDGIYNKYKEFKFHPDSVVVMLKSDVLNCACLDGLLDTWVIGKDNLVGIKEKAYE